MSDLKIFTENIEPQALEQIYTLIKQPAFSECKVRIMPDVHAGVGCVIGFTADLGDKVIPNIVGVDIGCGMLTVGLGKIDIDYKKLDETIHKIVPAGMSVNEAVICDFDLKLLKCFRYLKNVDWIAKSLGSLGGGNHFIEIDADEDGYKYLVIHTGSRNLGKQVAEYYQNLAIDKLQGRGRTKEIIDKVIAEYKAVGRQSEIPEAIEKIKKDKNNGFGIPKDLCYLEGENRADYLHDMYHCQVFAMINRSIIANTITETMGWKQESAFDTIHNYIESGSNIVRKGAISAQRGQKLLIPLNMRDGCIIGIGKGNPEWNFSAPHGAGRTMSRKKAKETVSMDEYEESMSGIFTTSVTPATIDESPMAYKPSKEIINSINETVEIVKIIKPVYNFKASD